MVGRGEPSDKSADCMRRFQADNAIAEQAEPVDAGGVRARQVQPRGHPISHSTNRGFKVRRMCEDPSPSVEIGRSGRIELFRASFLKELFRTRPPDEPWLSAVVGLDQFDACDGSAALPLLSRCSGPPCSASDARGVIQSTAISLSGAPLPPRSCSLVCGAPFPSRASGVGQSAVAARVRLGSPPANSCPGVPLSPSVAFGVGHIFTAIAKSGPAPFPVRPLCCSLSFSARARNTSGSVPSPESITVGVGHEEDEEPRAEVACAHFSRREQSAFNRETKFA